MSRRMQLDARSWSRSWLVNRYPGLTVRWVNWGGVSIWLPARTAMLGQSVTASRTWTGCYIAGASRSKSVFGGMVA